MLLDITPAIENESDVTANFFFDPTAFGSYGVSLSKGVTVLGTGNSNLSASWTYYWQLSPSFNVPFR